MKFHSRTATFILFAACLGLLLAGPLAAKAQSANARVFEAVPNAVGHAISRNAAGKVILKVYVEKNAARARAVLPGNVSGIPVVVEQTGKIVAF